MHGATLKAKDSFARPAHVTLSGDKTWFIKKKVVVYQRAFLEEELKGYQSKP
jgi:hypothetical protein